MKKILFIFLIINTCILNAQNNPDHKRTMHWYFGDKAGLDFSSGHPVADTTGQMTVQQGSATISDTSGHLLFYTDGKTVWNRLHQVMQNGTGLGIGQNTLSADGTVIIPKPGNNNIYYIFTVDGYQHQFKNGMRYHTVDMSQDNGNGSVIQKNIQLFTQNREQLAATKDSSGCGYWVTGHEFSTANFRAYHVTFEGVDTVAVISAAGTDYSIPLQYYYLAGGFSMKFTPDGNRAGSVVTYDYPATHLFDFIDILNFNKGNGQFTSVVSIPVDTSVNMTIGFSNNSKYLYFESGNYVVKDWQYDISSGDSATILSSKTLINTPIGLGVAQDWQIGYDGKMYIGVETDASLSVINYPNMKGIGCGFQKNVISLKERSPEQCLPRFVSNFLVNDSSSICSDDGVNEPFVENNFSVYPNPANEMIYINSKIPIKEIKIIDLMGITIYEAHKIRYIPNIDCHTFDNGIYIIQLITLKYKTISTKFIIQH